MIVTFLKLPYIPIDRTKKHDLIKILDILSIAAFLIFHNNSFLKIIHLFESQLQRERDRDPSLMGSLSKWPG